MAEDHESSFKWFLLISFSISWVSFFSGVLYGMLGKSTARDVLYIFGTIGPIIAFLSLMATYRNKEYNKNFWRRVYYPKIGPMWLVLGTVLLPIVLNMLIVVFSLFGSGPIPIIGNLVSKNGLFFLFSLIGVIGWYGYAYPVLCKRLKEPREFKIKPFKNPHKLKKLKSLLERIDRFIEQIVLKIQNIHKVNSWIYTGLIIGALWAIWYIPIVYITGSYPQILGVSSFGFWEFFLLFQIQSIIISWVYEKTKNSTFVVLIFFLAEITRLLFAVPITFQIIRFVLWILIAAFIIVNELSLKLIPIPERRENT